MWSGAGDAARLWCNVLNQKLYKSRGDCADQSAGFGNFGRRISKLSGAQPSQPAEIPSKVGEKRRGYQGFGRLSHRLNKMRGGRASSCCRFLEVLEG